MNRRQRYQNRDNARYLSRIARLRVLSAHTCENCGETGGHWVTVLGTSVAAMISGVDDQEGFYLCEKPTPLDLPEHLQSM